MTTVEAIPFVGARVRIKRDVLFTETTDGVLFHNAHGGFHLAGRSAYRFATLIVPYLNGEYRVRDLCEMLPPTHTEMISSLIRMLMERGLARDIQAADIAAAQALDPLVGERFREQIEYIDHFEDEATLRFLRFREARVAVLGSGVIAGWCALGLVRNGGGHLVLSDSTEFDLAVQEAAELTEAGCAVHIERLPRRGLLDWVDLTDVDLVVCTSDEAPAQVLRLLGGDGVPAGKRVLPLTRYGQRVVIGPMGRSDTAGCWSCAMLRLGFNGDSGASADVWRAAATGTGTPGEGPGRELSAMLGNLLAYEVFREFSQLMAPETDGNVIVQEIDSFDTAVAAVVPHSQCTFCEREQVSGSATDFTRVRPTAPVDSRPASDDHADSSITALDEISRAAVNQVSGVFRRFDDEWPEQLPLRISRLEFGVGIGLRRTVTAFDLHHVAAARMRAMRLGAATYLDLAAAVPSGDAADDLPSIPAERFTTFAGVAGTTTAGTGRVIAQSLRDASRFLVPVAAIRPYSAANAGAVFTRSGAGLGVGLTVAEATYRALLSTTSYWALTTAIRSGGAFRVSGEKGIDPELLFLDRCAADTGADVELLSLDAGPANVLIARSRDLSGRDLWSVGGDLSPVRAAKIALRDLLGQRQALAQDSAPLDLGHRLLDSFDAFTLRSAAETTLESRNSASVGDLLAFLHERGLAVYAFSDDTADLRRIGLRAVRVLLAERE